MHFPTCIYLFKVSNGHIRTMCDFCSKLTIKAPELLHSCPFGIFIVNFPQISPMLLVEKCYCSATTEQFCTIKRKSITRKLACKQVTIYVSKKLHHRCLMESQISLRNLFRQRMSLILKLPVEETFVVLVLLC